MEERVGGEHEQDEEDREAQHQEAELPNAELERILWPQARRVPIDRASPRRTEKAATAAKGSRSYRLHTLTEVNGACVEMRFAR